MKTLAVVGIVLVALLAGAAGAGEDAWTPAQHAIVVSGRGSVRTVPDRAQLSFGVSTVAKAASGAVRVNAAGMAKVIAALKATGIAAADLRTELVSLSPRTSKDGDTIVGYAVSNSVSATVRNLGRIGAVIDVAVGAGANSVSGPNLVRSDESALYRRALQRAIANARAKASTVAKAAGLKLRRITDVTEMGGPSPAPLDVARAGAVPATPIEPGMRIVQAIVTVTFAVS